MYIGTPPIAPTTVPLHGTYCSKDWVYFEKTHSCYVGHTSIGYTWQWTDGSQVDFLPFADQPVYQRVYFLDNKFWDFDKTQKLNFICKKIVR
uniref:Uncharacterized protein n=1 Tax=Panagrolaimus sp. ES5 TaxID=591445 RepID=A0AC34FPF3_9BILA